MSDIIIIVPSELLAETDLLKNLPKWGDGRGPTLCEFLNEHLSEMAYDENVHIITKVKTVELETRCPYPQHKDHYYTCQFEYCMKKAESYDWNLDKFVCTEHKTVAVP